MMAPHAGLERRVLAALDATPPRIPVVIGGCGSGRTTLLHALNDRMGRDQCQYVDVERAASTPERFHQAFAAASPFAVNGVSAAAPQEAASSARAAFDRTLSLIGRARANHDTPATFLFDEVLELRTFESFPGLRHVLREMLHAMAESGNRFVLTSRYVARAHRLLRDGHPRFEVIHLPPLGAAEVTAMLPPMGDTTADDRDYLGRTIQVLADGRAAYVRALGEAASTMRGSDPISALTALLTGEGALAGWCGHRYELRLHKARGYGALKAILEILAEEEPLTLTEVAQRLHRTPGSTKDYLSWLEDVDLIVSRQKRYSFADPLLRLWVRLHCRPIPPSVDEVAREVQAYAMARLPQAEPAHAMAGAVAGAGDRKDWGIIEID
ncbi:MAG: winged helix-turn-helix transcriptional regulator [Vicinamibacterales bacterium]